MTNSLFTRNTAYAYGAILAGASVTVRNSILWGNINPGQAQINSLVGATYSDVEGGLAGTGNINSDPLFANAAAGNFYLQSGSPAINVGNDPLVPTGVTTDLGGNPRFVGTVDMGPYEYDTPATPVVTTQPGDQAVNLGDMVSFSAAASGYPLPTIQWQVSTDSGTTWNDISGATALTLSFQVLTSDINGQYHAVFTNTNGSATTNAATLTLKVNTTSPVITSVSSTTFTVGTAGSFTVTATGNPAPTFTETGALPGGVTLSNAGVLSGTPAAGTAGSYPIVITASNGVNPDSSQNFTLTVVNPAGSLTLSPASLQAGTVGISYKQTLSVSGGAKPYTSTLVSGTLPAGLTYSKTMVISGTPKAGGAFDLTIQVRDAIGRTGSQAYTLIINAPTITLSPTTLPAGTLGRNYKQTLKASGGTSPYAYSVTSGSLPSGLNLSPAGALSGTPTARGSFTFVIRATDSSIGESYTWTQTYTLVVK